MQPSSNTICLPQSRRHVAQDLLFRVSCSKHYVYRLRTRGTRCVPMIQSVVIFFHYISGSIFCPFCYHIFASALRFSGYGPNWVRAVTFRCIFASLPINPHSVFHIFHIFVSAPIFGLRGKTGKSQPPTAGAQPPWHVAQALARARSELGPLAVTFRCIFAVFFA